MIGQRYWATGITIHEDSGKRWSASLKFFDDGFCNQSSTEGELQLRYVVDDIFKGVDTLVEDARRLGIQFGTPTLSPMVYCDQDGEFETGDRPDLRTKANEVGAHLGWVTPYREVVVSHG